MAGQPDPTTSAAWRLGLAIQLLLRLAKLQTRLHGSADASLNGYANQPECSWSER